MKDRKIEKHNMGNDIYKVLQKDCQVMFFSCQVVVK